MSRSSAEEKTVRQASEIWTAYRLWLRARSQIVRRPKAGAEGASALAAVYRSLHRVQELGRTLPEAVEKAAAASSFKDPQLWRSQRLLLEAEAEAETAVLSPVDLFRHLRVLRRLIFSAAQGVTLAPAAASACRTASAWAGWLLLGVLCWITFLLISGTKGVWQARFYPNTGLEGKPVQVVHHDFIDFDWTHNPPFPVLQEGNYSVRWDSCLVLAQPATVDFNLASDDGSRLSIDGEPVIDIWSRHPEQSQFISRSLRPGVHHLRVDYFDSGGSAIVYLEISKGSTLDDMGEGITLRPPGKSLLEPCGPRAARQPGNNL